MREALLQAIQASPDDDGPRLVYADWLTTNGDALGAFIVAQCRLPHAPEAERKKLRSFINSTWKAHGAKWLEPVSRVVGGEPMRAYDSTLDVFDRGFLTEALVPYGRLANLEPLFEVAPLLTSLAVINREEVPPFDALDGLLGAPLLSRLRGLSVSVGIGDAAARAVAQATGFGRLETLRLNVTVFTDNSRYLIGAGISVLVGAPHLAHLRRLFVAHNPIGDEGLFAISRAGWPLEELDASNTSLMVDGIRTLTSGAFKSLRTLRLARTSLPPEAWALLGAAKDTLPNLESLDLESCDMNAAEATAFFGALSLPRLKILNLESNRLADAGAKALASAPGVATLEHLRIPHNRFGQKAAVALANSPNLSGLKRLMLNESRWKEDVTALFAASEPLKQTAIFMRGKPVTRDK